MTSGNNSQVQDSDHNLGEDASRTETASLNEAVLKASAQSKKATKHTGTAEELRSLLEGQSDQSDKRFGNAIEKQKARSVRQGSITTATASTSSNIQQEYEYHTDRIVLAVFLGLLILSIIGWATYSIMSVISSDDGVVDGVSPVSLESVTTDVTEIIPEAKIVPETAPSDSLGSQVNQESVSLETGEQAQIETVSESVKPQPMNGLDRPSTDFAGMSGDEPVAVSEQSSSPVRPETVDRTRILVSNAVSRMALAKGVRNFEPVDAYGRLDGPYKSQVVSLEGRSSFRLTFFTHYSGLAGQSVSHQWYYKNQSAARIDMNITSDSWRGASNKLISLNTLGEWFVEAVDSQGRVLARQTFEVVR